MKTTHFNSLRIMIRILSFIVVSFFIINSRVLFAEKEDSVNKAKIAEAMLPLPELMSEKVLANCLITRGSGCGANEACVKTGECIKRCEEAICPKGQTGIVRDGKCICEETVADTDGGDGDDDDDDDTADEDPRVRYDCDDPCGSLGSGWVGHGSCPADTKVVGQARSCGVICHRCQLDV